MKVTKTIKDWQEWTDRLSKAFDLSINDKLTYCIKKNISLISKEFEPILAEYEEGLNDKALKLASLDEKKNIIPGNFRGFAMTPDNLTIFKAYLKKENKAFMETLVEIELYQLTDESNPRIKELDTYTIEYFSDILPESYLAIKSDIILT